MIAKLDPSELPHVSCPIHRRPESPSILPKYLPLQTSLSDQALPLFMLQLTDLMKG